MINWEETCGSCLGFIRYSWCASFTPSSFVFLSLSSCCSLEADVCWTTQSSKYPLKKYTIFLRNNSTVVCLKNSKINISMKKSPVEKQKFQKFDIIIQNTHVTKVLQKLLHYFSIIRAVSDSATQGSSRSSSKGSLKRCFGVSVCVSRHTCQNLAFNWKNRPYL